MDILVIPRRILGIGHALLIKVYLNMGVYEVFGYSRNWAMGPSISYGNIRVTLDRFMLLGISASQEARA